MVRWLVIAVLVLITVSGCGDQDAASDGDPVTTPAGEAHVSVPGFGTAPRSTTTAPRSLFEFVDFRVSGGIAGARDHLKVYPDGRATYDGGGGVREFSIAPTTVAELRAALEQANLASLPRVNGTVTADVQQYNVIYGGWSVRFVDGAMPAPLAPAVAILNRELARAKAGR